MARTASPRPGFCRWRWSLFWSFALGRAFLGSRGAMDWVSAPNIEDAPLPQADRGRWHAQLQCVRERLEFFLGAGGGQLPLWAVAAFGGGIALWFALSDVRQWTGLLFLGAGASLFGVTVAGGRAGRGPRRVAFWVPPRRP